MVKLKYTEQIANKALQPINKKNEFFNLLPISYMQALIAVRLIRLNGQLNNAIVIG